MPTKEALVQTINRHYIDGKIRAGHGTTAQPVTSAITGEQLAVGVLGDARDAEEAVAAAKRALPGWAATSLAERRGYLERLASSFAAHREEMIDHLVEEFGTPAVTAGFIVDDSPNWFLDAAQMLVEETFVKQDDRATVYRVPVGVAALITPWNGASWSIAMKTSVALAAGCTVVIKPSERGIWQAQPVLDAIADAGLPDGVINVVFGAGEPVGNILTTHPDVAKVSITGSTATGKAIARNSIDTMKRLTLELGGKSPTVILEDADVSSAVRFAVTAGLFNNGQSCTAGTRILIPASREAELKSALADAVAALPVGDPRKEDTAVGPVLDVQQYDRAQHYIATALQEGGELLAGGPGRPDGLDQGSYVRPTLIATTNDRTLAQEEVFAPVLALITYQDEEEAIAIANDTPYGLHAYVASGDAGHGHAVARRIQAGRVAVNEIIASRTAPFGGFKQSGLGREFGAAGISEFLEDQVVFS